MIWCAVMAPAHTHNCFQNLLLIFSNLFHDHIGVCGRRQYCTILIPTLLTRAMKKLKIDIFIWNFHYLYYQKYRFDAQCRCPHAPEVVFKTYLSQLFKQFHNHMGARRRRQYHFETYFGHKDYETCINWNFHVKFSSSELCKTTKILLPTEERKKVVVISFNEKFVEFLLNTSNSWQICRGVITRTSVPRAHCVRRRKS